MNESTKDPGIGAFSYLAGFLTASFIFLVVLLCLGYRAGFSELSAAFDKLWPSGPYYKQVLYLPDEALSEVIALHGVIDKAGNPTKNVRHNTIVVQPDSELGYVLRPNVEIAASLLKSIAPFNFAPPTLYLDKHSNLSSALQKYIHSQSRLNYSFSIDANGFRKTLPIVASSHKILLVGDSVPFGIGVDDEATMASCLQKLVGNEFQVINAGVGGYDGQQAFRAAKRLSTREQYSCLIYVACQNDFMEKRDWAAEAQKVLAEISAIADKFQGRVIIFFHTYMEYCLRDLFLDKGWEKGFTDRTEALDRALPALCRQFHFAYIDWTDIVNRFQEQNKSIFSSFALYADHCHLSPLGNQLAAEALLNSLENSGYIPHSTLIN